MSLATTLRLMNMFSPLLRDGETEQTVNPYQSLPTQSIGNLNLPSTNIGEPPAYDPYARFKELYQPRTDISRQYADALTHVPQYERPSAGRIIAAGITAGLLGLNNPKLGMEVGEHVGNVGNERRFQDFQLKTDALGRGAAEEDRYNTNQRILATDTVNKEQNQAKIAETERQHKAAENLSQQKVDISSARAKVYQFKAEHPDYKVILPKGGNVTFFNPQDPTQTIDTGLPTGTLTDEEAINLRSSDRINESKQRAIEDRTTIGVRGSEERKNIEERGNEARKTKQTPSANNPRSSTNSPASQLTQQKLEAAKLVQERPDLAKYIHVGTGGVVTIDPEGSGSGMFSGKGLTKEDRDLIVNRIQGNKQSSTAVNQSGRVKVKGPKGESGTVSAEDASNLPQGWTVVK